MATGWEFGHDRHRERVVMSECADTISLGQGQRHHFACCT